MFDYSHLPFATGNADIQTFNALSAPSWQQWLKPRGKSMCFMLVIGAGAGGGGGYSGAMRSARGGGGGGASGGLSRLLIPIALLPDILFCMVPMGGAGGTANNAGGNGALTLISWRPDSLDQNIIVKSGGTIANGGGPGSASAAGTAGLAGSAFSTAGFGLLISTTGQSGATGGAPSGAVGSSLIWGGNGFPLSGGAGGGGTTSANFSGGEITSAGWFPSILASPVTGANGGDGFYCRLPLASCGGAGGNSLTEGQAGTGGNAAIGSGGGGGGAGLVGGSGGVGGAGLIMIVSW